MGYNSPCDNRRQQVSRFAGIIRVAGPPAEGSARGVLGGDRRHLEGSKRLGEPAALRGSLFAFNRRWNDAIR